MIYYYYFEMRTEPVKLHYADFLSSLGIMFYF